MVGRALGIYARNWSLPDGHSCPLCGSSNIPPSGIAVHLQTNLAIVNGETIQLTPKQAEVLSLFCGPVLKRYSRERIFARVWGMDSEVDPHIVAATTHHLNKRLMPCGYRLRSQIGRGAQSGYWLERTV